MPETNAQVQTEPTTNSTINNANAEWKSSIDKIFEKLDNIIENKSNGVARSALRDNGFDDEEIKNIVKEWKANKQTQKKQDSEKLTELNSQVETLNAQLKSEKINNQAFMCGLELGLDSKTIPYVVKLADLTNAVDDKGELSIENIKTSLSKVLDDVPSLKPSTNNGFFKIGADNSNGAKTTQEDVLANIFGTKKK